MKSEKLFLNGEYILAMEAKISVNDRGFHFGDGLYDIMLLHKGKIIDWDWHFDRMTRTANRMYIRLDYTKNEIENAVKTLIDTNKITHGRVIIVVSRGESDRWEKDLSSIKQNFMIRLQEYDGKIGLGELKSIKLKTYEDIRWKWRDIKVNSLLPSVILRHEAGLEGFDDVLYYNEDLMSETSRGNIFIAKDGVVKTPIQSSNLLCGITKTRLLELFKKFDIPCEECDIKISELFNADEVFSTSATARVVRVSQVDEVFFTKTEITELALKIYDEYIENS